jgi:hypothetical protein
VQYLSPWGAGVRVKREGRCQQEIGKKKEQKKKVFGMVVVVG